MKNASTVRFPDCIDCGRPFCLRTTANGRANVCPECRPAHKKKQNLEWHRQYKLKHGRPFKGVRAPKQRVCPHCSTTFSSARNKYCSTPCRVAVTQTRATQAAAIANKKPRPIVLYAGPPRTPPQPAARAPQRQRHFTSGRCRICSAWFVATRQGITCSPACATQHEAQQIRVAKDRRRARKRNAYVADVNRQHVYQRDGYRCHLCRKKTIPTQTAPHPRAPTIDHVIPLAAGGTHEPSNCRTACFHCNATKGDRGGGEQLLLIA